MKELDLTGSQDNFRLEKLVLAFWLGSNSTLESLQKHGMFTQVEPYIYTGYYCFLLLDKQISLLHASPKSAKILRRAQRKLLICFNENYHLLTTAPKQLVLLFMDIVKQIDVSAVANKHELSVIEKAKTGCHQELSRVFNVHKKDFSQATKTVRSRPDEDFQLLHLHKSLQTFALNLITWNFDPHLFYKDPLYIRDCYLNHKIFVTAVDGVILEGQYVKKKGTSAKNLVILLVGHFQVEHSYLYSYMTNYFELFNSDLLFINHRNHSQRAARLATDSWQLARDVVSFVRPYAQTKRITLYGMCGGAAHMILAATILRENDIKFKLIIDRFMQKYSNPLEPKSVLRRIKYDLQIDKPDFRGRIKIYLALLWFLPIFFLAYVLVKGLFIVTGNNIDFAKVIRTIPEQDLLILQAKPGEKSIDGFIHPANDIRLATKDRRVANKIALRSLVQHCLNIAGFFVFDMNLQMVFLKLYEYFDKCLQLIDSERLIPHEQTFNEIHSWRLYSLTTQNRIPLQRFLYGFFSPPPKSCSKQLAEIIPFSGPLIQRSIDSTYANYPNHDFYASRLAASLELFFKEVCEHSELVCYMADRVLTTELGDITQPLKELLDSRLFKQLNELKQQEEYKP